MTLTDVYCRVNRARGMEVFFIFLLILYFLEIYLVLTLILPLLLMQQANQDK